MSPVKLILPSNISCPFSGVFATLFVRSVSFFSVSACFVLFEITFLFINFFSVLSNSVFSQKFAISALVAKFAFSNLAVNISTVKLLWSWSVFFFKFH